MDEYIVSEQDLEKISELIKEKREKYRFSNNLDGFSDSINNAITNYIESKCEKYTNY